MLVLKFLKELKSVLSVGKSFQTCIIRTLKKYFRNVKKCKASNSKNGCNK